MSDNISHDSTQTAATTPTNPPGTPSGEPKPKCDKLEALRPPDFPKPKVCEQPCCCPQNPSGTGNDCLVSLIKSQSKIVSEAETAKAFVEELTEIQKKVESAKQVYTKAKYDDLVKIWEEQDGDIVKKIEKMVCIVKCWECLIECRLCPLLYEIRAYEQLLEGTGKWATYVDSLPEKQAWQERNVAALQTQFDRIKDVLKAWEDPAKTLTEVLAANRKRIDDFDKMISEDPAKAVYVMFMEILPLHLAIQPHTTSSKSKIDTKYTTICSCDDGKPEPCCGPDTGVYSLRNRLLGPQPYLADPAALVDIICCLADERYRQAKDLLATATADLAETKAEIQRIADLITAKKADLEKNFKAELGNPIKCDDYYKKGTGTDPCEKPSKPTTTETSCD